MGSSCSKLFYLLSINSGDTSPEHIHQQQQQPDIEQFNTTARNFSSAAFTVTNIQVNQFQSNNTLVEDLNRTRSTTERLQVLAPRDPSLTEKMNAVGNDESNLNKAMDYRRMNPTLVGYSLSIEELRNLREASLGLSVHEKAKLNDFVLAKLIRSTHLKSSNNYNNSLKSNAENDHNEVETPFQSSAAPPNIEPDYDGNEGGAWLLDEHTVEFLMNVLHANSDSLITLDQGVSGSSRQREKDLPFLHYHYERNDVPVNSLGNHKHIVYNIKRGSAALPVISETGIHLSHHETMAISNRSCSEMESSTLNLRDKCNVPSLFFFSIKSLIENESHWTEVVDSISSDHSPMNFSPRRSSSTSSRTIIIKSSSHDNHEFIFYGNHDHICKNMNSEGKTEVEFDLSHLAPILSSFDELPIEIHRYIYHLMLQHKLLTVANIQLFNRCSLPIINLSGYPKIGDAFLSQILTARDICQLDLSGCRDITDIPLSNAINCHLEVLKLDECCKLNDYTISKVIRMNSEHLMELSVAKCYGIIDGSETGSAILECTRLISLELSFVKGLPSLFLCQLTLLIKLQVLKVNSCPGMHDSVLAAWSLVDDYHAALQLANSNHSAIANNAAESNVKRHNFGLRRFRSLSGPSRKKDIKNREKTKSALRLHNHLSTRKVRDSLRFSSQRVFQRGNDNGSQISDCNSDSESEPDEEDEGDKPEEDMQPKRTGLRRLRILELGWTNIFNPSKSLLSFRKLRKLVLSGNTLHRDTLTILGTLTEFEVNEKENEWKPRVPLLGKLKELHMNNVDELNMNLSHLDKFHSTLEVFSFRYGCAAIVVPTKLMHLKELNLSNTRILENHLIDMLSGCMSLEKLILEGCSVTNDVLDIIATMINLKYLDLGDQMLKNSYSKLGSLSNLEVLKLHGCELGNRSGDVEDFRLLAIRLKNLKHLNVDHASFDFRRADYLCLFPQLTTLYSFQGGIKSANIKQLSLSNLKYKLTELTICSRELNDEALIHMQHLKCLKFVNISHNYEVTDVGIGYLANGLRRLEHLAVAQTGVTDTGILKLLGNTKLQQLNLRGLEVDTETVGILFMMLPHLWQILV